MRAPLAVRCTGLVLRFGGRVALGGVDLEVPRGEILVLVGPDGAGKTTLLRVLCGLLHPTAGEVWVFGKALPRQAEAVREQVGYVPQQFGLYGDLTVWENLQLYATLYQVPRGEFEARARELLSRFRLSGTEGRLTDTLSGGMKQKLALACALVHRPHLLLLDEPTTGVDPVSRRQLWRILYDLHRQGITLILTTSYVDEAERGSRVGFLYQGRLVACDDPRQLRASLPGQVLEVVAWPRAQARSALRSHPQVRGVEVFGDRDHVYWTGPGPVHALQEFLEHAGVRVERVQAVVPSLEDVFVARLAEAK